MEKAREEYDGSPLHDRRSEVFQGQRCYESDKRARNGA